MKNKADLILHPVRLKIILTIMRKQRATALQLNELLPEVPQATLYRHINKLAEANLLTIVEQVQVRGVVEKVYAVSEEGAHVTQADLEVATRDDHMRYFTTFISSLMHDFSQYVEQPNFNLERDRVGYRQLALYLSDDELEEVMAPFREAVMKAIHNTPAEGRRRRTLSFVIMPEAETTSEGE
ncbi:helix-turn-helix domain-containing protein [Paenibacillus sp. SC116]|uniref:helix-turn-helix domain-containing protein n=1 Tax=Paenibacillus sp. SC116 TaxID=2968986 RepID=UPI00215A8BA8|nr:helix-turn-helix domain-containing protein [Paenibacillus sp. SC116]MCR8845165.1 helix-turn-helix domain-containing protein [Paenibacillus sp. SC116]